VDGNGPPPWLALHPLWLGFTGLMLIMWRVRRGTTRRSWLGQQQVHGPTTMQTTADGLLFLRSDSRSHDDWSAFKKYVWSADVLLLYLGDLVFHIVPLRAFPDAAAADAFRAVLEQRQVPTDTHRPPAFPVAPAPPAATPPPLPASRPA
jgi:hypothetical protein